MLFICFLIFLVIGCIGCILQERYKNIGSFAEFLGDMLKLVSGIAILIFLIIMLILMYMTSLK